MENIVGPRAKLEQEFLRGALLPVRPFLPGAKVAEWCAAEGYQWRTCLWTPLVTLLGCAWKQLTGASARGTEGWVGLRLTPAHGTDADGHDFCAARGRLPEGVYRQAVRHVGAVASDKAACRFHGWVVRLVDATTLRVPRSAANSAGLGHAGGRAGPSVLPLARLLVQVCLGSGAVVEAEADGYRVSEMQLYRRLLERLPAGEVEVVDRGLSSFLALWQIRRRGSHVVARLHQTRGGACQRRLGPGDEIQLWRKPRPAGVSWPDWAREAPEYMEVRVIRGTLRRRGYRDRSLALCTTLLDPVAYPAEELIALYLERWKVELDFRTFKAEYGLERLTGRTPEVVRREIHSGLLAYNLVRAMMAETGEEVRRLSAKRSRCLLLNAAAEMAWAPDRDLPHLRRRLVAQLARAHAPRQERPAEPRLLVDSPQNYPLLTISRAEWKRRNQCA